MNVGRRLEMPPVTEFTSARSFIDYVQEGISSNFQRVMNYSGFQPFICDFEKRYKPMVDEALDPSEDTEKKYRYLVISEKKRCQTFLNELRVPNLSMSLLREYDVERS